MPNTNARAGWIGPIRSVLHFLGTVGADRDDAGNFKLYDEPITVGYGGDEAVIPAGTTYTINGRAFGLAVGLRGTSYGVVVGVVL